MAAAKSAENDYNVRKGEKTSDSNTGSRRAQKSKALEYSDGSQKKQTRAKTRIALTDDTIPQSSVNKVREKGRALGDLAKDGDALIQSKKDRDSTPPPKKDMESVGAPKKDVAVTLVPKKDVIGSGSVKKVDMVVTGILKKDTYAGKKDVSGSGQSKNGESIGLPKDVHSLASSKKDIDPSVAKNRKFKVKISGNTNSERRRDERFNNLSKTEEFKSEVTTSEKSKHKDDKLKAGREGSTSSKTDREIMNSDVTSSVDEKPSSRPVRNTGYGPVVALGNLDKEGGWFPGDIAWGRVGQHPFWPCLVAIDPACGIYTKTKRVGRGQSTVQQSLHVQFFGDNGRHSWIPTTSVIKYEGPEQFHKFADKVLGEPRFHLKKKDKKNITAFHVKPSTKPRWETAIHEAELSVPKAREERIEFFRELLPKRKTAVARRLPAVKKVKDVPKVTDVPNVTNGTKVSNVRLVKKRNNKRPNVSVDETSPKQIKVERQVAMKDEKKTENTVINAPTRKKRGRNKN